MRKGTILCNDPSITGWGYAILDWNSNILTTGVIKTHPESKKRKLRQQEDRIRRIQEINLKLLSLIKEYDVVYIISELPHGSQNAAAAVTIGMCADKVQTIGDCLGLPVEWFSENDIKKTVVGRSAVSKENMARAISKKYPDWKRTWTKVEDHEVCDALACHYTAIHTSPTFKFLNKDHND